MEFEILLQNEFEKLQRLKTLRSDMQCSAAFDVEDVTQVDQFIQEREKYLGEKQRILEDVCKLQQTILEREKILQNFEDETNILKNSSLIQFFKEKQRKLISTLNKLND